MEDNTNRYHEVLEEEIHDLEGTLALRDAEIEDLLLQVGDLSDQVEALESRTVRRPIAVMDRLTEYLEWVKSPNSRNANTRHAVEDALFDGVRRELYGI